MLAETQLLHDSALHSNASKIQTFTATLRQLKTENDQRVEILKSIFELFVVHRTVKQTNTM